MEGEEGVTAVRGSFQVRMFGFRQTYQYKHAGPHGPPSVVPFSLDADLASDMASACKVRSRIRIFGGVIRREEKERGDILNIRHLAAQAPWRTCTTRLTFPIWCVSSHHQVLSVCIPLPYGRDYLQLSLSYSFFLSCRWAASYNLRMPGG